MTQIIQVDIQDVKENENNPRKIKKAKLEELKQSIIESPHMINYRTIVVDENMIVAGGTMRLRALRELEYKKVPVIQILREDVQDVLNKRNVTYEELIKEFIVKDNIHSGEWDLDKLEGWNRDQLKKWDIPVSNSAFGKEVEAKVVFSEHLDEAQNYIVLTFDNEIDWLNAKTHFGIKSVHSKRANGKPWSKGVGRVLNGAKYLKKLRK